MSNLSWTKNVGTRGVDVTPSDSTPLDPHSATTVGIYVGGTAGTVVITMADGTDLTLEGVQTGSYLTIGCTHVKATGTTATGIVAFF